MGEEPRWATADDDAALRELCKRTPMRGAVSYILEREPDFFALTRLQGDDGTRVGVIADRGDIAAMVMMAPMQAWIGGEKTRTAYLGDLKVHPEHRGHGLAGSILRFLGEELKRQEIDLSSFLVLCGNPMVQRMAHAEAHFGVRKLRKIRNFLILFGSPRRRRADVATDGVSLESIPEMIDLWNRVNSRRLFAPVLDERLFARWTGSTLTLDDFRIARQNGRIVAFCAAWDASAIKQIRVLRLSPALLVTTSLYNVFGRLVGRPRFPKPGERLRFLYVAHACAERPEDLEALLLHIHDEYRRSGYLYMDLALDAGDPLVAALRRFRSMTIDFDLWEARTPGRAASMPSGRGDSPAWFEMSMV